MAYGAGMPRTDGGPRGVNSGVEKDLAGGWNGVRHLVPDLPELAHLLRFTQRDAHVIVHGWELAPDDDVVLLEVVNHRRVGPRGVHHDEISPRVNRVEPARFGL